MPSHFSSLGFAVESDTHFQQLAQVAAESGEVLPVDGGTYVRWSPGAGVELWVQANDKDEIVGVNPFFAGEASMRVGLVEAFTRPGDWPLDGGFRALADPHEHEVRGDSAIVFDLPDARRYGDLPLPCLAEARLVLFSHGLAAWPSEGAFRGSQEEFKLKIGAFMALGEGDTPEALVSVAGVVRAAAVIENPFSGGKFQHARIDVPGGAIDVVADVDVVDGEVVAGGVVAGTGWLVGRVRRAL